jgi:Leucine-rich repeat (LRR) protein
VRDISELAEIRKLAFLDLSSNMIEDVGSLLRLRWLRHLNLSYNEISDVSAICNLTELEVVRLSDNRISKIPDMVGFVRLGELDLRKNRLRDISGLIWLSSLSRLKLEGNPLNRAAYRRHIRLITERNGSLHERSWRKAPRWIRRLDPRLVRLLPWYDKKVIVPNGRLTYDADNNYWVERGIVLCLVVYITVRIVGRRRRRSG